MESLYYLHSSLGHSGLMADSIDYLLPNGRQLKTNAHPLVEIIILRQPQKKRTLLHFVNISGHSSTAYFEPVNVGGIEMELDEDFKKATVISSQKELQIINSGRYKKLFCQD